MVRILFLHIAAIALSFVGVGALAQPVPKNLDCAGLPGAESYLSAGRVVMIGEGHGTKEMPATFLRIVCTALEQGRTVAVGLEIEDHDGALDAYTSSKGTADATKLLLGSRHWRKDFDGRSSKAYFNLLESLRVLRTQGAPLTVFALYDRVGQNETPDQILASRLRKERLARPHAVILTLTGNVHSMRARPDWFPAEIPTPMGALIADLHPLSIDLVFDGGQSWSCRSAVDCGLRDQPSQSGGKGKVDAVQPSGQTGIYDLQINVGRTAASPPAISVPH
jgi:hypothetical protein